MPHPPLDLTAQQILAYRRQAGALNARLPFGPAALRTAAWAGLQDSMPRAALLSLHARVAGITASAWEHPCLVQVWGPRFSVYVVAADDHTPFTLGRLPMDVRAQARAHDTASRMRAALGDRALPFGAVGRALGVPHNSLRYATATGTVLLRWDGARQPTVWMVDAPALAAAQARMALARRYLRVFGPGTTESLATWAGIRPADAAQTMRDLAPELLPVRTPLGPAWMLAEDETALRAAPTAPAPGARLLPSGDAYTLLWGADRELLVPNVQHRALLWTPRVWPGAVLLDGDIVGVWRRPSNDIVIDTWRRLTARERQTVEAEALGLPLPGLTRPLTVSWQGTNTRR